MSRWTQGSAALTGALAIAVAVVVGCSDSSTPTGPQAPDLEPGSVFLVEGSVNWTTNSVSWVNENANGIVPETEFGFIAVSQQASSDPDAPSHFFFTAPVRTTCNDAECFPGRGGGWVDGNLEIEALDWSQRGAQVVAQGRRRRGVPTGQRIFLFSVSGTSLNPINDPVNGLMPSFSPDGTKVIYVQRGPSGQNDVIREFNTTGAGGAELLDRSTMGVEHPRLSPDGSRLAYSATDGARGRRIWVWDAAQPANIPRVLSDPDAQPTRDGETDRFPTWSPNGTYVAYASTRVLGTTRTAAIYVRKADFSEPNIVRMFTFEQGDQIGYLRWHPSGRRMLIALNNNIYVGIVPEGFWDQAP